VLKILELKKANPGTVLMVEVGYRYKFFGDDAKVNQEDCLRLETH
jgi:DNA mismatch repair protein MSH3